MRSSSQPAGRCPQRTFTVAVYATDPITELALSSHLNEDLRLIPIGSDRSQMADVTVIAVEDADRVALDVLRTMSRSHARGIFIVSRRWYIDLHTAVDCGLRGVIWRSEFTPAKFISTITAVGQGGADLPPDLQGKLLDEVQRMRRDVLAPHRLIDPCLTEREIAVLRLVADGCTLAEITSQLPYSERTVKHVLHNVMRLLNVRNRAHAVSYAVRAGLI